MAVLLCSRTASHRGGSNSGPAWFNDKLSSSYIYTYARSRYAKLARKLNFCGRCEFLFYGTDRRRETVFRLFRGLRSPHLTDVDLLLVASLFLGSTRDSECIIAKLTSTFASEMGSEFIARYSTFVPASRAQTRAQRGEMDGKVRWEIE